METRKRSVQPGIHDTVRKGLSDESKYLPEWLLMNEDGVSIFAEVARLEEFYPAHALTELDALYSKAIAYNLRQESRAWNVVMFLDHPLVSYSLLSELAKSGAEINFIPVTSSALKAEEAKNVVASAIPSVLIREAWPYFTEIFNELQSLSAPTLYYFGPAVEVFEINDLAVMLKAIASRTGRKDRIIGHFDLLKSPAVIEKAYQDPMGINAVYCRNALVRMNRELRANFDARLFEYWPIYDAVTGTCRRYLVSQAEQLVKIPELDMEVTFHPWETISIGLSQKYDDEMIGQLLEMSAITCERKLINEKWNYAMMIMRSIRM